MNAPTLPTLKPALDGAAPPRRSWRRTADSLVVFLPIVVMAVLALGSFWLVRSSPAPEAPTRTRAPSHQPDTIVQKLTLQSFRPDGSLQLELRGREARRYPDTETLVVDAPNARSWDAQGAALLATADTGQSNRDASVIDLSGHVRVTRAATAAQAAVVVEGSALRVDSAAQRVTANEPVTLSQAGSRISANTLDWQARERVLQLQGRVRGTYPGRAR